MYGGPRNQKRKFATPEVLSTFIVVCAVNESQDKWDDREPEIRNELEDFAAARGLTAFTITEDRDAKMRYLKLETTSEYVIAGMS